MRPATLPAVALALGTAAHAPPAAGAPARPNVLFVIADDWSYPHAGAYGDRLARTPHFDRVAAEGMLFANAFTAAPSCTPSRAAILTGQWPHRLEEGGNLMGFLPSRFAVYPDLLEQAGYVVGHSGKGWGPGKFEPGGRARNPAGPPFAGFAEFLATVPAGRPFVFWFGSRNPHRPYREGTGEGAGLAPPDVKLPPVWPDTPEVRADVLDYYGEVAAFDRELGSLLAALDDTGRGDDTLVAVTSDNGMPFPRAKANLYELGTHMPLAIRWPRVVRPGRKSDAFVSLADLAPTFIEAAGLPPRREMTGRSLMALLRTGRDRGRPDHVFLERERHAWVRKDNLGYPARAVRTRDFLYGRNLRPERWPAGDPEFLDAQWGDCDGGPTKYLMLGLRGAAAGGTLWDLSFAPRPAEELYDRRTDPDERRNVADDPAYRAIKKKLRALLDQWMAETADPRVDPKDDRFDGFPYFSHPTVVRAPRSPPK